MIPLRLSTPENGFQILANDYITGLIWGVRPGEINGNTWKHSELDSRKTRFFIIADKHTSSFDT
jgi:hypothetical protein